MRRSNLLTLRKYFNWHSSWYDKYQYQELILRDTVFYVYLISLFKILKIPTSMFKLNHFSANIIYIECDIYVRWTFKIIKYVKSFYLKYLHVWTMFKTLFHTNKHRLVVKILYAKDTKRFSITKYFLYSFLNDFDNHLKNKKTIFLYSVVNNVYNPIRATLKIFEYDYFRYYSYNVWLQTSNLIEFFSFYFFFKKNKLLQKHNLFFEYFIIRNNPMAYLQDSFYSQKSYFSIKNLNLKRRRRIKIGFTQFHTNSFFNKYFMTFPDLKILFAYKQLQTTLKKKFFFKYFNIRRPRYFLYPKNIGLLFSNQSKSFLYYLYRFLSKKKKYRRFLYDRNTFLAWYIDISVNYVYTKLNYYYLKVISTNRISSRFSFLFNNYITLNISIVFRSRKISYLLFKNSFQLKTLYLFSSFSSKFFFVSKIFKFYFLLEFFNQFNTKLELTFFNYSGNKSLFFFVPNLFLLYKPYLTSAKLICDFVFFKLKTRCNLNSVYKSVKVWQLKERSLIFYSFKKSWNSLPLDRKEKNKSLLLKTNRFKQFVNYRIPLLGIRILLTGPPYKARRKIKKYYHLWVANHAITGNMPLQTFNLVIDYYQTSIILRRASLGLKVWILFESYKELK